MEFSIKQLSVAFVIISLAFLWTYVSLKKIESENKKLKIKSVELKKMVDSLGQKIFNLEVELFRQKRAVAIFENENPNAASQLSDIISDETE